MIPGYENLARARNLHAAVCQVVRQVVRIMVHGILLFCLYGGGVLTRRPQRNQPEEHPTPSINVTAPPPELTTPSCRSVNMDIS